MSERVSLFSNGCQFLDWLASSCDACSKSQDYNGGKFICDLQEALWESMIADGAVDAGIAARLGKPPGWCGWRCKEFVPIGAVARATDAPGQGLLFGEKGNR